MSSEHDQANSDPLPYTQVDRAVKQTAAMIAGRLGVPFQHALGGLVQFWDLNGDPRDIEALLIAGKTAVVLQRDEVARRFTNAMGVDAGKIDPDDLTTLRLLERLDDGTYRVRGMSRYLKPLQRRAQARAAAAAGGKASAKARAAKLGTAQPRSGAASASASGVASGSLRETAVSGGPGAEALFEAPPNTAVSGQRSSLKELPVAQARPGPVEVVFEHYKIATKKPRAKLDARRRGLIERRFEEGHTVDDLQRVIDGYEKSPWHNGENERHRKYLNLELMLRDAGKIESGLDMANGSATSLPSAVRIR